MQKGGERHILEPRRDRHQVQAFQAHEVGVDGSFHTPPAEVCPFLRTRISELEVEGTRARARQRRSVFHPTLV